MPNWVLLTALALVFGGLAITLKGKLVLRLVLAIGAILVGWSAVQAAFLDPFFWVLVIVAGAIVTLILVFRSRRKAKKDKEEKDRGGSQVHIHNYRH